MLKIFCDSFYIFFSFSYFKMETFKELFQLMSLLLHIIELDEIIIIDKGMHSRAEQNFAGSALFALLNNLSHENKKALILFIVETFLIENECNTPIGCLTFIFYQKYFFMVKWTFLFSCEELCEIQNNIMFIQSTLTRRKVRRKISSVVILK